MQNFLSFALPSIGQEEIAEVLDTLETGWLTTGAKTRQFEQDFRNFIGSNCAVALNSATAGLHLALEAIGIGPGDKVITTPYTFTATAEVIRYLGADPLFVDIQPGTFNIDPQLIADVNMPEVRAVLPVHFAGQACDMDSIVAIARARDWRIVEDAAHALPTTYKGQLIGTLGDLTVYSFYATKPLTTGEGGMVVTHSSEWCERIRTMRLHGINKDIFGRYHSNKPEWYYEVVAPGFKYNMTDIASSIGIHQLRKVWHFQNRRQEIAQLYNKAFVDLPLRIPHVVCTEDTHAWHLYTIQLVLESLTITRDEFIEKLMNEGVGVSVHYIPLHVQPYWRDRYGFVPEDFPVAYDAYRRAVSLPIYPKMADADVERVIETVKKILLQFSK